MKYNILQNLAFLVTGCHADCTLVERLLAAHANSRGVTEAMMERAIIRDWTFSKVPMQAGGYREVQHRVYRDGSKYCQEICETDGTPVHTLELPEGMKLDRSTNEVLLR